MVSIERQVWDRLAGISDPEIPAIGLVDLGVIDGVEVDGRGDVTIRLMPTFVGCPALQLMRDAIRDRVADLAGVASVDVQVILDPAWTTDRITDQGRRALREYGLTPPKPSTQPETGEPTACPYCGSRNTALDNHFGPTPCRAIHYCNDCRQPFERFKELL